MFIPKDFFSREDSEDKSPRRDGLDPEILDYYLNEAFKNSPAYIDLKAKRFNTSFRSERRRHEEIEIFTPEEEAAFEEERRMLYGDQNRKEEEAVAAAYKFADALAKVEQLCPKEGINQDESYKEFDRKLEEEIRESKKTNSKSAKKGRGKKKDDIPQDDSGPFCMWKNLDLSDIPKPFVEKEDDLLARWQAEVEARKKESFPASSIEEPVAGPSYMSSFDPDLEDIVAKSTPKPDMMKSEKVLENVKQKGKNKLSCNQVPKKEEKGKKKLGSKEAPKKEEKGKKKLGSKEALKKEEKGKKKLGSNQVPRKKAEQKR